jgi:hypothetical protein
MIFASSSGVLYFRLFVYSIVIIPFYLNRILDMVTVNTLV